MGGAGCVTIFCIGCAESEPNTRHCVTYAQLRWERNPREKRLSIKSALTSLVLYSGRLLHSLTFSLPPTSAFKTSDLRGWRPLAKNSISPHVKFYFFAGAESSQASTRLDQVETTGKEGASMGVRGVQRKARLGGRTRPSRLTSPKRWTQD